MILILKNPAFSIARQEEGDLVTAMALL